MKIAKGLVGTMVLWLATVCGSPAAHAAPEIVSAVFPVEHIYGQPRITVYFTSVPGYPVDAKLTLVVLDRLSGLYYRHTGAAADMSSFMINKPVSIYIDADKFQIMFLNSARNQLQSYQVSRSAASLKPLWKLKLPRTVSLAEFAGYSQRGLNESTPYETLQMRVGTIRFQGAETQSLFNLADIGSCHPTDQHRDASTGACVDNARVCAVASGTGTQYWHANAQIWGTCTPIACDRGLQKTSSGCR